MSFENYNNVEGGTVFSSSNTLIQRVSRKSDGKTFVIKKPSQSFPDVNLIESFKKDFQFTKMLHSTDPKYFINMEEMVEQKNGSIYLVEEEGSQVPTFISEKENFQLKNFLRLAIDMATAVSCSHAKQVLHRDIKTSNFLIGKDKVAKLIDFGLAIVVSRKSPSVICNNPIDDEVAFAQWNLDLKKKVDDEIIVLGGWKSVQKLKKCNDEDISVLLSILSESIGAVFLSALSTPLMIVATSIISLYYYLNNGLNDTAAVGLGMAGWNYSFFYKDPNGYQITLAAEKLVQENRNPQFNVAAVEFLIGMGIVFGGSLKQALFHFDVGSKYAIAHGEYVFGAYNLNNYGMIGTVNGYMIPQTLPKMKKYQAWVQSIKNFFISDLVEAQINFMQDIAGISKWDPQFLIPVIRDAKCSGACILSFHGMLQFHNYEFENALESFEKLDPKADEVIGFSSYYDAKLFHALTLIHFYKTTKDEKYLKRINEYLDEFKTYAQLGPEYLNPRNQLLNACFQTTQNDISVMKVLELFEEALESSTKFGLPIIAAVTNEAMLDFCEENKFLHGICNMYFVNAFKAWSTIGAKSKCDKLKKKFPKYVNAYGRSMSDGGLGRTNSEASIYGRSNSDSSVGSSSIIYSNSVSISTIEEHDKVTPSSTKENRTPFQRDFDKVIFSSIFRRLSDKTQVFPMSSNASIHTRLTHSLEVSAVGKSLSRKISEWLLGHGKIQKDHITDIEDIVSTSCLIHDIGNPPYGHAGEDAMRHWWTKWNFENKKLKKNWKEHSIFDDFKNFEGNASGFRLLRKKLKKLTFSTMATYTKYPKHCGAGNKIWKKNGIYLADLHVYEEISEKCGLKEIEKRVWERHPLTYIMEASDDICYCVMDIEDALKLNVIKPIQLETLYTSFFKEMKLDMGFFMKLKEQDKIKYWRKEVINYGVEKSFISFTENYEKIYNGTYSKGLISENFYFKNLKKFALENVYPFDSIVEIEIAGYNIILTLMNHYLLAALDDSTYQKKIFSLLPSNLQNELNGINLNDKFEISDEFSTNEDFVYKDLINDESLSVEERKLYYKIYFSVLFISDYVTGMADGFAKSQYQKIIGIKI
eukprot:gene12343-6015_t